ncbi:MAG: hypothetical protein U5K74_13550 [Gemmatimonadaceae bacterium]|nr:hypothetical protein [Gemmatimonadaceae bacterium]
MGSFGSFDPEPGQGVQNSLIGTFRNRWSALPATGMPNGSLGMSVGGSDPVFGQRIGYLVSGNYGVQQNIKERQVRAYALARAGTEEVDRFEGDLGRYGCAVGRPGELQHLPRSQHQGLAQQHVQPHE